MYIYIHTYIHTYIYIHLPPPPAPLALLVHRPVLQHSAHIRANGVCSRKRYKSRRRKGGGGGGQWGEASAGCSGVCALARYPMKSK